jgi:hypothetical protein
MQILALISVYAPVVITTIAVIAVVFSFFWVFLPLPRAMGLVASSIQAVAGAAWAGAVEICRSSRALSLHEMDINKMLAELRTERVQVEEAIVVLERLASGQGKRRGRPPA